MNSLQPNVSLKPIMNSLPPKQFLKPIMNSLEPNQSSNPKQSLHHALKNKLSNINLEIPQLSFSNQNLFNSGIPNPFCWSKNPPSLLDNLFKKNLSLSAAEIKKRMSGIPVYTVYNYSEEYRCTLVSDSGGRKVELFFISKSDAEDYAQKCTKQHGSQFGEFHTVKVPLSDLFGCEGGRGPIRLVPELSQVKDTITTEERRKDIAGSAEDVSLSGVPVYQADGLVFEYTVMPGKKYRPVFLRKEDLERTLVGVEVRESGIDRSNIQVAAFKDTIQAMKDCSTSKWNDVVFIAPGLTLSTWIRWDLGLPIKLVG